MGAFKSSEAGLRPADEQSCGLSPHPPTPALSGRKELASALRSPGMGSLRSAALPHPWREDRFPFQPTPSRSVGERGLDQSSPALYAKLLEDPPQVSGDGSRTAAQFTGDFAVGEVLRHEPNDLSLPIC